MPKLEFSPDELKGYFRNEKTSLHCFYDDTVESAHELRVHRDGIYPEKLLEERRPNESLEVRDYRKSIFVPKTKPYFLKILTSLNKIRRSSDWNITYRGEWPRIPEGQQLLDYCEKNYPGFDSVTNWVFAVLLSEYLVDANALVFVYPDLIPEDPAALVEPTAKIFGSDLVLDFVPGDYAVLKNPAGCVYTTKAGPQQGDSFFVVTTETVTRYDQTDGRKNFAPTVPWEHKLGFLPLMRVGGIVKAEKNGAYMYESRIAGIVPEFNEALREYSDLQAAKVLHLYPERWEFSQTECASCKGTGVRANPAWYVGCPEDIAEKIACQAEYCHGGYIASGPFAKMIVRPSNQAAGELNSVPTPPAGFVEKDVQIITIQENSVNSHIYNGLAAHNFEFLAAAPLNQSGVAKEVDRDELNNSVNAVAEDLVKVMDFVYKCIAHYRYSVQYNAEQLAEMRPTISVPEKFDILSATHLEARLKSAKESKVNPLIISVMELDYFGKAFNTRDDLKEQVELMLQLDPLANVGHDEKGAMLQNKGITKLTYIISANIGQLVMQAIEADAKFMDKKPTEQRETIKQLGQKILDEIDAAAQAAFIPPTPPGLFGTDPEDPPPAPTA